MFYFNLKPSEELSELLPRPTFGLRQAQPTPRSDGTKDAFRPSVDAWMGRPPVGTADFSPGQRSASSAAPSIIQGTVPRRGFVVGRC